MSALGKRAREAPTTAQKVSPPPVRRRKLVEPHSDVDDPNSAGTTMNESRSEVQVPKVESSKNRLRIFSWNVNGVEPFLQRSIESFFTSPPSVAGSSDIDPGYSLRNFLRRHHWPEILCLQEVKISARDTKTKRALERAANPRSRNLGSGSANRENDTTRLGEDEPTYTVQFCLPRDRFNARGFAGRVYGVCTLIRDGVLGDERARMRTWEVGWDLEGRVLVTEIEKGKRDGGTGQGAERADSNVANGAESEDTAADDSAGKLKGKLAIINGYWVNGTDNPYRDPTTGVIIGTRHDRKRAFHALMLQECKAYEERGYIVILVGDMNIARSPLDGYPGIRLGMQHVRNRADLNAKFIDDEAGMRGVDVWRHLYGDERRYTYYGRGHKWGESCDRVDLVVCSRQVVEQKGLLVDAGILDSPEERGHSDHVPLWVEFDLGVMRRFWS